MASSSAPAGSVSVEVVADLSKLDAGLGQAQTRARSAGSQIAGDLGKVESAAKGAGAAADRLAGAQGRAGASTARAATASERWAAQMARAAAAAFGQQRALDAAAAANDNLAGGLGRSGAAAGGALTILLRFGALAAIFAAAAVGAGALAAAVAAIAALVPSIINTGSEFQSLERGFAAAAGSAKQGEREFNFISQRAEQMGIKIGDASKQFMGFLAASQGTALQGKATRDIFIGITDAMTALKKSPEETGRALVAIQQMMSKGKIGAEEMSGQLGEALPGALNLSAKAMGVTQQALLKMMEDGKLLAADFLPKLAKELQATYGDAAAKAAMAFQASMNRLSNAWKLTLNEIYKSDFGEAFDRLVAGFSGTVINFLRENQGLAKGLGQVLASVADGLRSFGRAAVNAFYSALDGGRAALTIFRELDAAAGAALPSVRGLLGGLGDAITGAFSGLPAAMGGILSSVLEADKAILNGVIGAFVAAYQASVAAWGQLPAAFNDLATQAGNALIGFAESAVNAPIGAYNAFVGVWNDLPNILARIAADAASAVAAGLSAISSFAQSAVDSVVAAWYALPDTLAAIGNAARAGLDAALAAAGAVAASAADFVINAWSDLPGAFGRLATAAGNALITGIEAAANFVLRGVGKLIDGLNTIGSAIPGISFTPLEKAAEVSFGRITNTSAGAAAKLKDDISGIAKAATSRDYLGEAGGALSKRFNDLTEGYRKARDESRALATAQKDTENAARGAGAGLEKSGDGAKKAAEAAKQAKEEFDKLKGAAEDAFQKLFPEDALRKKGEELQGLLDKYRDQLAKIDPRYVTAIETQIKLNLDGKELEGVKAKADDLAKEMSQAFRGVFDEMFSAGNKGFDGLLSGFTKSLSRIGSRMLEQSVLGPLFGGKEGAGAGGLSLGGFDFSKIEKAVSEGSFDGLVTASKELISGSKTAGGAGGFASSKLGGGLLSAGVGASIGYQSQSPLVGALGGAASGFAMGGPVGGVVGGIAGLLGGLFGRSQAKKEAQKKLREQLEAYKEAYKQAEPEIKKLQATFRGESLGNIGGQIDDAFQQAYQANKTASQAGDQPRADQIMRDFEAYAERLRWQFIYAFEGTLKEVSAGFGTSGPFAQANAAVASLGESLKAFVADAQKLPEPEKNGPRARAAAQQATLAALDPPKALSDTQSRLAAIQGTASGLTTVLKDLGMSAEQAATAIRNKTAEAMKALRAEFSADLKAKTNEATGKGYLNEVADLVKEREALLADARAIGAGTADVSAYFKAAAQKIVDGSELTGAAFDALVKQFPTLKGAVVEFGQAVDTAAAQAEAAARRLSYQDRAFVAGTDTSTQAGALAAFDRKAAQDRAAEAKAGGQAMADLEKALAAERTAIIKDFAAQAAEAERAAAEAVQRRVLSAEDRLFAARNDASTLTGKLAEIDRQHAQERAEEVAAGGKAMAKLEAAQAAERLKIVREAGEAETAARKQALAEAQTFLDGQAKSIRSYLDNLKAGPDSALSPGARLKAAEAQYAQQYKLAKSGDRDALSSLTQYADRWLDAGKDMYASGPAYQKILAKVTGSLSPLPKQVSAEQFIVDAIRAQTRDLKTTIATGSASEIARALKGDFAGLDANTDGLLSQKEFLSALGPKATVEEQRKALVKFGEIDLNGDGQLSKLELLITETKGGLAAIKASEIARALTASFATLDLNADKQLTMTEYLKGLGPLTKEQTQAARKVFYSMDRDRNNFVSQLELVGFTIVAALKDNSPTKIATALKDNFPTIDVNADGGISYDEMVKALGPKATKADQQAALLKFQAIDLDGDKQITKLELLIAETKGGLAGAKASEVAKALSGSFGKLDTNTNGLLSQKEFLTALGPKATVAEQQTALAVFREIDLNGDGQLSKLELTRIQLKTAIEANRPAQIQKALAADFTKLDKNVDGLLTPAEFIAGLDPLATSADQAAALEWFKAIDANGDGLLSKTELMRGQLLTALKVDSPAAMATALAKNLTKLDIDKDGLLSSKEFLAGLGPLASKAEQQAALRVFNAIDLDGDGQISKLELMRGQLVSGLLANSPGAIATALKANFATIDANSNKMISKKEYLDALGSLASREEQVKALAKFAEIDLNGDNQLSKLEVLRFQLRSALEQNRPALIQKALSADFGKLDANTDALLSQKEFIDGLGPLASEAEQAAAYKLFQAMDQNGDDMLSKTELMRGQLLTALTTTSPQNMATALKNNFPRIDVTNNGGISLKEYKDALGPLASKQEQLNALKVFQAIDLDGDGQLSKLEALRTSLGSNLTGVNAVAKAVNDNFATLTKNGSGGLSLKEFKAAFGPLATAADQRVAEAYFKNIDADGDGIITKLELARKDLLDGIGKNSPTSIAKALKTNFPTIDVNNDNAIDWKEFKAALGPLATRAEQLNAKKVFDAIDLDGNGVISAVESLNYDLVAAAKSNSPTKIATALKDNFPTIDVNADGGISYDEMVKALGPKATKADQDLAKRVFDSIDADGDRIVTAAEVVRKDLLDQLKLNDPAKMAAALSSSFATLDLNKDKLLTMTEYLKGLGPLTAAQTQAARRVFYSMDKDRDNFVSQFELVGFAIIDAVKANSPDAFATALNTNFSTLDKSVNGILDKAELQDAIKGLSTVAEQKTATDWIKALDTNGDDQLTQAELAAARLFDLKGLTTKTTEAVDKGKLATDDTTTAVTNGNLVAGEVKMLLDGIKTLAADTKLLQDGMKTALVAIQGYQQTSNENLRLSKLALDTLKTSGGTQEAQLKLLNKQYTLASPVKVSGSDYVLNNGMLDALNKIVFNTGQTVSGLIKLMSVNKPDGLAYAFAEGGYTGPGGKYEAAGIVHRGEVVWSQSDVARAGGVAAVEAMRLGVNDNRAFVSAVAMPVPVPVQGGGMDVGALVAELRALRAEQRDSRAERKALLEMVARVSKAGSDKVAGKVEETTDEVAGQRDDNRRSAPVTTSGRAPQAKVA